MKGAGTFTQLEVRFPSPAGTSSEALPPLHTPGPTRRLWFLKVYSERLARQPQAGML